MTAALLVAATLFLFAPSPRSAPQSIAPSENPTYPLRNTFVVAAETVIDTAGSVDLSASRAALDGQMRALKTADANLAAMARDDDQEKQVVDAVHDMIFSLTACTVQAREGSPTTQCQSQFDAARNRAMEAIGKHKSGDAWADGPPSAS